MLQDAHVQGFCDGYHACLQCIQQCACIDQQLHNEYATACSIYGCPFARLMHSTVIYHPLTDLVTAGFSTTDSHAFQHGMRVALPIVFRLTGQGQGLQSGAAQAGAQQMQVQFISTLVQSRILPWKSSTGHTGPELQPRVQ